MSWPMLVYEFKKDSFHDFDHWLTLLVLISDFVENAKCLKLPWFYRLLMFQCATQICGHFLFCTQCQFPNFPFLVLKIDLHSQLYFHHFYRVYRRQPCAIMARFGEKLQNQIEPVIRDFIDCMEPGTPRVEIESYRREDSCQVFIRFKKSLSEKHSLFQTGFKISSESDVRYLRWFLYDIVLQWRFWHPSQEEDSTDCFSDSSSSILN